MSTHINLIDFDEAKKGDLLMIPELTLSAELSIVEVLDVYETNFQAKGVAGFIKKPIGKVARLSSDHRQIRIELLRK